MNILFSPCHYIYDEGNFGSEISWAFNIADRLCDQNRGSVVITGHKEKMSKKGYRIIEAQKEKKGADLSLRNALVFNWQYFLLSRKEITSRKYDIIHHVLPFQIQTTYNLLVLFGLKKNIPLVIGPIQTPLLYKSKDVNSKNVYDSSQSGKTQFSINIMPIAHPILRYLSKRTLLGADKVVTVSEQGKKLLMDEGVPKGKIAIIPPGIDCTKYSYRDFNEKDQSVVEILTAGYLQDRKAVDLIIKAIAIVVKENKNICLRIVGDGPQRKKLENLVMKLKLQDYVIFQGFVPNKDIPQFYHNAHIYVSMSRAEAFATVSLESMASGLPLIAADTGTFSQVIDEGKNGFVVKQEDYKMLAERILFLLNNKQLIQQYGYNARRKIEKEYDWDKAIIPQYIKIYDTIVHK